MFRKAGLSGLLICLYTCAVHAQPLSDTEKLASLCKVWGLLKYHQPVHTDAYTYWDNALLERIEPVLRCADKNCLSALYLDWLKITDGQRARRKKAKASADVLRWNEDLSWIQDTQVFTEELSRRLYSVQQYRDTRHPAGVKYRPYVFNADFSGEQAYKEMRYPSGEYRLLALFRYWNMVQYFFPYRYAMQKNWMQVLEEKIPLFRQAGDSVAYQLALAELAASPGDGHAYLYTPRTQTWFGTLGLSCRFLCLGDTVLVRDFYNDSLCRLNDLRPGDILLSLDGEPVGERMETLRKYIGASNEDAFRRDVVHFAFLSDKPRVKAQFIRNGERLEKELQYFSREQQRAGYRHPEKDGPLYRDLGDSIAYIHLGRLMPQQVDSLMRSVKTTRGIVFDLRSYPQGTLYMLAAYLLPGKRPFALVTRPLPGSPGQYTWDGPLYGGGPNKDPYRGKTVLLMNAETQSQAEFTCMLLQTVPGSVSIGSATSGADGNVSEIVLPGNYRTYFSGIGVYYPDKRPTQGAGLQPDIYIKPTVQGIREGRDELLERAVQYIKTGQ